MRLSPCLGVASTASFFDVWQIARMLPVRMQITPTIISMMFILVFVRLKVSIVPNHVLQANRYRLRGFRKELRRMGDSGPVG